jgi:phenylpyruvate tautomerase PptA (4-oxalocrotonate tautomerase family)
MPHLQFEITATIADDEKRAFADWVTALYAERMDTGTGHVGVTIRAVGPADLSLGRAAAGEGVAFLNADIRRGRSLEDRRALAVAIMDEIHRRWGIPTANMYVIYTEHDGEDFMLYEGPLRSWAEGDDPL